MQQHEEAIELPAGQQALYLTQQANAISEAMLKSPKHGDQTSVAQQLDLLDMTTHPMDSSANYVTSAETVVVPHRLPWYKSNRKVAQFLAISVGQVPVDLSVSCIASFLLVYLERIAGLTAAEAGLAILCAQLCHAVTTPSIGMLSDWTRTRRTPLLYRRKFWHFSGVVLSLIALFLIFCFPSLSVSSSLFTGFGVWYFMLALCLFYFGWACAQVSHAAVIADVSSFEEDGIVMTSGKLVAQVVCGIIVYSTLSALVLYNSVPASFAILTAVIGCLVIPFMLVFYCIVPEKFHELRDEEEELGRTSDRLQRWLFWEDIKRCLFHTDFFVVCTLATLSSGTFTIVGLYIPMFIITSVDLSANTYETITLVPIAMAVSLIVAAILNAKLIRSQSTKGTFMIGSTAAIVGASILFIVPNPFYVMLYISASILSFGLGTMLISALSLQATYAGSQALVAFVGGAVFFFVDIITGILIYCFGRFFSQTATMVRWVMCGVPVTAAILILLVISILPLPQMTLAQRIRALRESEFEEEQQHNQHPMSQPNTPSTSGVLEAA